MKPREEALRSGVRVTLLEVFCNTYPFGCIDAKPERTEKPSFQFLLKQLQTFCFYKGLPL